MAMTDPEPAASTLTRESIVRSLRLSVMDGLLHAVMVGVAESYLGAFAVQLGHRDVALALLLTVPLLVGALCQLLTAVLVSWVGSRKRVVVLGALLQAASHLLLLRIALTGDRAFAPLMLAATLFLGSGALIVPAWSSWMGALTRGGGRERYFSRRSAVINVALLFAMCGAGFALSRGETNGTSLSVFAGLFVLAMLARVLSATALAMKVDPEAHSTVTTTSTMQRARVALRDGRWRVALFIAALMFGAHFSVPFFTPYMLRTLHLSMFAYSALTAAAIATKAASFSMWRVVGERWGLRAVLLVSVVTIVFLPVQWVWFTSVASLMAVQVVSGVVWGGFEYASLQLLLRDAPEGADVEFFSLANSLAGALQVAGALCGGALLLLPGATYHTTFIASSVVRGLSLLLLIPLAAELYRAGPLPLLVSRVVSMPIGAVRRLGSLIGVTRDGDDGPPGPP